MPNLLGVLIACIVSIGIGALWYSPVLFGNVWMKLTGFDKKKIEEAKKKGMVKSYLISFLGILVMVYILGYLMDATSISFVLLAVLIWRGFMATTALSVVLWEGKSFKLYLINVLHHLVVLLTAGVILSLF